MLCQLLVCFVAIVLSYRNQARMMRHDGVLEEDEAGDDEDFEAAEKLQIQGTPC